MSDFTVGVAQGVVTGIRGLCNGLGPALFGFVFYLFNVDLNDNKAKTSGIHPVLSNTSNEHTVRMSALSTRPDTGM